MVDDIDLEIVLQPRLCQLAPNESSGERCRVTRYIKISSKIGNGADMILMPMRENDSEQLVATLLNDSQIGKEQVDAGIAWIGIGKAQIYHDPFYLGSIEIDIHAHLYRPHEGQDNQFIPHFIH